MKRFLYVVSTIFIGVLIHLVFHQFLSLYGISPQLLLLFVVCHGFLAGPIMGQTMGFIWGVMLDSIGISFFGMQSFLFALAGYAAGKLRRRVAGERPSSQLVVGFVTSLYYFSGVALIKIMLVGDPQSPSLPLIILGVLFNVLLVIAVFWVSEWWLNLWQIEKEKL